MRPSGEWVQGRWGFPLGSWGSVLPPSPKLLALLRWDIHWDRDIHAMLGWNVFQWHRESDVMATPVCPPKVSVLTVSLRSPTVLRSYPSI